MIFLNDAAVDRLRAAADAPDLAASRYRLVEKIGEGGMGSVYRVEDSSLGRHVALKVINLLDSDGHLASRLLREARIIAQLEHPGIVPVHDIGTLPDGRVFYTMKLVQGKRLDEKVRELSALPERLRAFQKICEAVAFAHARGVLHRDLKPENVMLGPFGEVLVMDWGVSKIISDAQHFPTLDHSRAMTSEMEVNGGTDLTGASTAVTAGFDTADGVVIGTPGYMAPEQARGERDQVSECSDVYSLGAILKFLMQAEISDPVERRHGRPWLNTRSQRILAAIIDKAMAPEIVQRYKSVSDLQEDVGHYLDGLAVKAYPESWLSRSWRWIVRNRVWLLLVLAYLVMRTLLILFRRP